MNAIRWIINTLNTISLCTVDAYCATERDGHVMKLAERRITLIFIHPTKPAREFSYDVIIVLPDDV